MHFNGTRWLFRHKWVVAVGLVGLALMACRLASHPTRVDQYILLTSDEYHWPEDHIFAVLPDGSQLTRLGKGFDPSCSPDGRRIAFAAPVGTFLPDGRGPYTQIFVMDADGSNVKQLTFGDDYYNRLPVWSPDGQRLAFRANGGIAIMDLNTLKVTYLTNLGRYAGYPAWSPDGQRLVFYGSDKQDEDGLYMVNADGSNLTRLTSGDDWDLDWSPDGRHIVFLHGETVSSPHTLRVIEADGSNPVDILPEEQGRRSPRWSPDGQQIIFVRHYLVEAIQEWRDGVFMVNADGSEPKLIVRSGNVLGWEGGALLPLLRSVHYGRLDWCKVR